MRVKVKVLKDCVIGRAGAVVNVMKSQLPRFTGLYELVNDKKETKKTAKKEVKKAKNKAILDNKNTKNIK